MLAGSEDLSTTTVLLRGTAALILGASVQDIVGAGHMPAIDHPGVTGQLLGAFTRA